jgi:hypothetical protein
MTGIAGQAIGFSDQQLQPIAEGVAVAASSRGSMEPFIGFFKDGAVFDPAPVDFADNLDNVTASSDGVTRFGPSYSDEELTWVDVSASLPQNTVAPVVTGQPQSSNTLTCNPGTWTDAESISFRWYRDNVPMIGQQAATLVVIPPYIGSDIFCLVTAGNEVGTTSVPSNTVTIIP